MLGIAATIAPVFLIVFLGFILRRIGIADDRWTEILNKYGLYIGFPALIFHSLIQVENLGNLPAGLLVLTALLLPVVMIATWSACTRLHIIGSLRNTYVICVFYGNVAYLGFPVVVALLPGSEAVVSAFAAVYLAVLFTVGIAFLEYTRGGQSGFVVVFRSMLGNPLLLAVLGGITCVAFGLRLPAVLLRPLSMLSATASPIVLIALGVFIARHTLSAVSRRHALAVSGLKLLALPVIFWCAGSLLPTHPDMRIAVLEAAMPVGLTPFALAELYPLDREIISSSIVFTTLFSALTLFVCALLLGL